MVPASSSRWPAWFCAPTLDRSATARVVGDAQPLGGGGPEALAARACRAGELPRADEAGPGRGGVLPGGVAVPFGLPGQGRRRWFPRRAG